MLAQQACDRFKIEIEPQTHTLAAENRLRTATQKGQVKVVRRLIKNGVNVNAKNFWLGYTALI